MKRRSLGIGLNMLSIVLMLLNTVVFTEVIPWVVGVQFACAVIGIALLAIDRKKAD